MFESFACTRPARWAARNREQSLWLHVSIDIRKATDMSNQGKIRIFAGLLALLISSSASAEKLCLKVVVNKKNGKVTTSRTIAASCPRGFTELVDTSAFVGPQGPAGLRGPTGPAGANGINGTDGTNGTNGGFDLTSCRSERVTFPPCEEGNACGYDVACGDDGLTGGSRDKDLMINWSWDATENGAADL